MFRACWLIVFTLGACWTFGCDSGAPTAKSKTSPSPATEPATTQPDLSSAAPTTEPATQPATLSQLTIDGKLYSFPSPRLRVVKAGNKVLATLYTNDPKAAINDDYKGNRYYLLLHLDDIHEPQQVYTSVWQFKARSREYVDSNSGIFLEGDKYQLEPFDATARFIGDMLMVRVELQGEFLQFDQTDPAVQPRSVFVKGFLLAPVEYKD